MSSSSANPPDPSPCEITDLVKRYPTGVEALKGVSLEIADGEFFGLLGPNGAGKSTLIHCSTGLASPTSGEIRVFGHDAVGDYRQAREAVGLRAAGTEHRLVPHGRGDPRLPRWLLRHGQEGPQGTSRRAARILFPWSISETTGPATCPAA